MTFKQKPEYQPDIAPDFAPAYRELYDSVSPSEQLLAATRRLYSERQSPALRRRPIWPAAAATLCCACLLLAFGLQMWPPAENLAPPENAMQMRMASQPDDLGTAGQEPAAKGRMAEPAPNDGIALLNDAPELASTPEMCGLPLEETEDETQADRAKYQTVIEAPMPPQFFATQCVMLVCRWLGMW